MTSCSRPGVRLGVDVGDARVGLAASDPAGVLASPVATLTRDADGGADILAVAEEAAARRALEVVVGLPRNMDGTEGEAARKCRAWAGDLQRVLTQRWAADEGLDAVPAVRLVDERLTTVDAHRALRDSGRATRDHRAQVDQAAAVLILQTTLEAERATGSPPGEILGRRKPRSRRAARSLPGGEA